MEMEILEQYTKEVSKEVYVDLLKPSTQIVGNTLGRTTNMLLAPLRALVWSYEQVEELLTDGINKRIHSIPEINRKTPDVETAVPLVEALRYKANNETLREMFLNLLTNTMDNRCENDIHPSYVETLKQMNTLDAIILRLIYAYKNPTPLSHPTISVGENQRYIHTPEWVSLFDLPKYDLFDISASLVRLSNFSLVRLSDDKWLRNFDYSIFDNFAPLKVIEETAKRTNSGIEVILNNTKSVCTLTDHGKKFSKICL